MSIFYYYAAITQVGPPGSSNSVKSWVDKLLPARKKLAQLSACSIQRSNIVLSSLWVAMHHEMAWWIERNITEYHESRSFVLPNFHRNSLTSMLSWKIYWYQLKERVLPSVLKYQATFSIMWFFQKIVSMFVSRAALYRLTQHPPSRAVLLSSRESDRLSVGMEVCIISLWANLLFCVANYVVDQVGLFYVHRRKRSLLKHKKGSDYDEESILAPSLFLFGSHTRRYFYSSIGSGVGSIFSPGFGTLVGIGLGDCVAKQITRPSLPEALVSFLGIFKSEKVASSVSQHHDELVCGCCQIVRFSHNPQCLDRAPISSRACDHTICRSCVQKCHLALMERFSKYSEWIRCPLCNAEKAFSSHDHLVNRSLCAAIAVVEKREVRAC